MKYEREETKNDRISKTNNEWKKIRQQKQKYKIRK